MFKKKDKDSQAGADDASIIIFGAPWCAPCNQLKRRLEDDKINYSYKNVDEKENETEMLEATDGRYLIPTVVVGDRVMQNPTISMVKDALKDS